MESEQFRGRLIVAAGLFPGPALLAVEVCPADAFKFALLENAQQLRLKRGGHFADLIEENGASLGQLQLAFFLRDPAWRFFGCVPKFQQKENWVMMFQSQ
jgi:hypothetical protein